MDMGFTREQATVALNNTTSVEQATEYILSNPMPAASSVSIILLTDLESWNDSLLEFKESWKTWNFTSLLEISWKFTLFLENP